MNFIKTKEKLVPQILIFDVDGVLVDVRGTYWHSALDTVRYIVGDVRGARRKVGVAHVKLG